MSIEASGQHVHRFAGSILFDWRLSPRFDVYAGAMYSEVSNGLASGFIYNNTIDPTIGTRFAF